MSTQNRTNGQGFFKWAGDILLIDAYRNLFTQEGSRAFTRSLWLAVVQGVIEAISLFSVIPAITAWSSDAPCLGLRWPAWILLLAILAVVGALTSYVQQVQAYTAAMDLLRHLNIRIGNTIASLPLGWFRRDTGATLSRLCTQSLMSIAEGSAHYAAPIVRGATTTVTLTLLAWTWSWYLGAAFLVSIPVLFLLSIASRWLKKLSDARTQATEEALAKEIVDFTRTQPSLRAAGRSRNYQPLEQARAANEKANRSALWLGLVGNLISGMGVQAITVSIIVLAAWLGGSGSLDPLATVAFIGVSLRFTKIMELVSSATQGVENARSPIRSINEILDAPQLPEASTRAELTHPGEVSLHQVGFGYREENPVVSEISFTARPGTLTAIVGPSGSGKTTLFRLIARFWDVQRGSVSVGGVDVRQQPTEQLMEQLSMVFQDVYLYGSTLGDNIKVGRDTATDAEVRSAGQLAGVEEIAERLPQHWDAPVGEGGQRLSGGERQRVSVARALLKEAPIVLFDEATSALDPENEAHVEASIDSLRRDATVLVIAHKLHTIRNADQIVVLNADGSLAQVGTHEELLNAHGLYQQLWQARENAQGWSLVNDDRG